MAITRQKKEEVVSRLNKLFEESEIAVFTDFKGMDVNTMTDLRGKVREAGGQYLVAKKRLIRKVLEDKGVEGIDPTQLEGEIAIAFGKEDAVALAKSVYEINKELEAPQILTGLMGEQVLTSAEVVQLAQLPSRTELLAKVVGSLNSPMSGMVNVLNGNIRGLVYALNAIADKKQ